MVSSEKRRSERFSIQREIEVVRGDQRATGATENLSLGGALLRVALDPPWRLGDRVKVTFRLPELSEPVHAEAQVRWINDIDPSCVGVQFTTGFRARETWALNRLFSGLESDKEA